MGPKVRVCLGEMVSIIVQVMGVSGVIIWGGMGAFRVVWGIKRRRIIRARGIGVRMGLVQGDMAGMMERQPGREILKGKKKMAGLFFDRPARSYF